MVITHFTRVSSKEGGRFAWSGLRRFHNVGFVSKQIIELQDVPRRFHKHVPKQAQQLRYCLQQAREYAEAASVVSLATKPVLLYYSAMNLALAEILYKQPGDSNLERGREQHGHHGLSLRVDPKALISDDLSEYASGLVAVPLIRGSSGRFGTFELWHRSAREMPIIGENNQHYPNGATSTGFKCLFSPSDERLPLINEKGITLLEVLERVPTIARFIGTYGIRSKFVRAKVRSHIFHDARRNNYVAITFHPSNAENFAAIKERIRFQSPKLELINFREIEDAGELIVEDTDTDQLEFTLPASTNVTEDEVLFWVDEVPLNEFGYIYVGLHILGNFARYYPDHWIKAVEDGHPIAHAAESLVEVAEERLALATLSEMLRSYCLPTG